MDYKFEKNVEENDNDEITCDINSQENNDPIENQEEEKNETKILQQSMESMQMNSELETDKEKSVTEPKTSASLPKENKQEQACSSHVQPVQPSGSSNPPAPPAPVRFLGLAEYSPEEEDDEPIPDDIYDDFAELYDYIKIFVDVNRGKYI